MNFTLLSRARDGLGELAAAQSLPSAMNCPPFDSPILQVSLDRGFYTATLPHRICRVKSIAIVKTLFNMSAA
ncbi:hypothetical protein UY3_13261 [Chelonia mydas]|uniref:Uncharacterized protein n=1 Tax=Chelonia mydas TaxID=8469 RepID=M7BBS6_CHEMY|nr:hypothetical protein UY3_13261 [Chelonia mydas]